MHVRNTFQISCIRHIVVSTRGSLPFAPHPVNATSLILCVLNYLMHWQRLYLLRAASAISDYPHLDCHYILSEVTFEMKRIKEGRRISAFQQPCIYVKIMPLHA
ncbi:hypothetical protein HOLleu_33452 [Holothuria leucospilota]|uniref:Uncharacterized protein n=1 Tax=Holothuria leucospilota TaxID=206669 RepID=A0A9Q0YNM2_HOLLE|nr:hypothetical protein HOLleu_33452 [Holothuria leucospilota]